MGRCCSTRHAGPTGACRRGGDLQPAYVASRTIWAMLMRNAVGVIGVLAVLAAGPATREAALPTWMLGEWRQQMKSRPTVTDEVWVADGGVLRGTGKSVRHGKVTSAETMRIEPGPDGTLQFVARPEGKAETVFRVVEMRDGFVAFENRKHDFPQRIEYERVGPNVLRAKASAEGKRSIGWVFRRVTAATTQPTADSD